MKNVYISFREDSFLAFDVPKNIFLKHLLGSAYQYLEQNDADWIKPAIEHWNVNIIVNEYGFHLNEQWSQNQIDVVSYLIDQVCEKLSERTVIYASEMKLWGIDNRGIDQVRTEPVIELGRAIQALLREKLPAAPDEMMWFYGTTGRSIITYAATREHLRDSLSDDLRGDHLYIHFRDNGFWAFETAIDIFLRHLIDRANYYFYQNEFEWLCEGIKEWEINSKSNFSGMYLDEKWAQNQFNLMLVLIEEVCEILSEYSTIPASEWDSELGKKVIQNTIQFPSKPVIELGRAIQSLLREDLPIAPDGKMWLYGTKNGRRTIDKYKPKRQ